MEARRGDALALARAAEHARPVALAREQTLPVVAAFESLLPDGGLRRGSTVAVAGVAATSLALALTAEASATGSWVGVVGLGSLGLAAAAEVGVALERLVLVADPPAAEWGTVVATLVDGADVVVVRPSRAVRVGLVRRVQARVRERGAVLVMVGATDGFERELTVTASHGEWMGVEHGVGHLRARRLTVEVAGRRAAARPRQGVVWLPDAQGGVRAETGATVVPLRGAG